MLYAIVAVIMLIMDQWLKYWTTLNVALDTGTRELIPGVISLVNIHNTGAAFGILRNARWFFIVITVIFVIAIVYMLSVNLITGRLGRWAALAVLAGALGNCIDRLMNGYVVDMFQLEFVRFAVFNVADICITCGGALFCYYLVFFPSVFEKKPARVSPHGTVRTEIPAVKDPFAEWEQPPQKTEPVSVSAINTAEEPAASKVETPGGAAKNAPDPDEFSLESILSEFRK